MFSKRRDGTKLKISGFEKIWNCLKSKRSENEVYILKEIDVTNLKKYYDSKKIENEKLTYFHLFSTAISKIIYNKPLLNRFVINGNKYSRNEVTLSFVAKTDFTDEAKELLTVMKIKEDDNLETISHKIINDVKKVRNNQGNNTDNFIDKFSHMPKIIIKLAIKIFCFLDNHDMLPKSLTNGSIYHSTVLLSNLGSIHCTGIYHNLTNFGTNSLVITIGEIKKVDTRYVCEFGMTIDERIADGVYFAKCINLLEYVLNNPSLLEDKVNDKININKNK